MTRVTLRLRVRFLCLSILGMAWSLPEGVWAAEPRRHIPSEYEAVGGMGPALNNSGVAGGDAIAAVRTNPALLPLARAYTLAGGYIWPAEGREFYQASIVDGQTSKVAAGVTYTGFSDEYRYSGYNEPQVSPFDSPVVRRGVLGVGETYGRLSLGIGATYVEGHTLWNRRLATDNDEERVKGFGVNGGAVFLVNQSLSLAGSVENASNRRIRDFAPRTYRAGLAYAFSSEARALVDYRQRERVAEFEPAAFVVLGEETSEKALPDEGMVIGSFVAQVQNVVRLMASYGQDTTSNRRSLAGGLAIVNKTVTLSYAVTRSYMSERSSDQGIALSLDMAM